MEICAQVNIKIFHRSGTIFRKYMENTVEDLCGVLAGGKNLFLDKVILDHLKASDPGIIHSCPYVRFYNFIRKMK